MSARGFVEGRRAGTPPAKITDREIQVEDARNMTRAAQACRMHLADLVRAHDRKEPSMPNRKPTRTKSRNSAAQEFNATTVGDGRHTLGTLHGSAPRIEARDLQDVVVGVFPTRAEAVQAIIAARAKT
jgi:hypothetical protein